MSRCSQCHKKECTTNVATTIEVKNLFELEKMGARWDIVQFSFQRESVFVRKEVSCFIEL
jgi:hypothetical protein